MQHQKAPTIIGLRPKFFSFNGLKNFSIHLWFLPDVNKLYTWVFTFRTSFSAWISQKMFFRNARWFITNGSFVAFVTQKSPDPGKIVSISSETAEILRVFHQVSKVSIAAHGHHKPVPELVTGFFRTFRTERLINLHTKCGGKSNPN